MRWASWVIVVLAMHFVWEMAQAKWFSSMVSLSFWTATLLCFRASVGDVAITVVAFFAAAAVAGNVRWPLRDLSARALIVYVAVGLVITVVVEIVAIRSGRWSYAGDMPTLFGIGLLPLTQWIVVPLLGLVLFRLIWNFGDSPLLTRD